VRDPRSGLQLGGGGGGVGGGGGGGAWGVLGGRGGGGGGGWGAGAGGLLWGVRGEGAEEKKGSDRQPESGLRFYPRVTPATGIVKKDA